MADTSNPKATEAPAATVPTKPEAAPTVSPLSEGRAPQASPGKVIRKLPPGSRRALANKAKRRTGPFIKYVGDASLRIISVPDWGSLPGVEPLKAKSEEDGSGGFSEVQWGVMNDKMVECLYLSETQQDYCLIDDMQPNGAHSFLEVDYNEDGELVQVEYDEDAEL